MFFFGKSKELEERVAQLEQELNEAKRNAAQELQAEREKYAELETQVESLNAERDALAAEKANYEEAIEELKQQNEAALDEEKTRSNDALIALREHIYADRADLMNRSEKELSVETLMALSGFGTRMERLERRYADLLKAVNTEVSSVISSESEGILGHFRDAKAEMIDAFTAQSEAIRSDYGKVNQEALQTLSSDTQAVVKSFQENTAQMLEDLAQKSETMRSDYGRINEESLQALSANSRAVVDTFQEKTAQMLDDLAQKSETMRSDYGRINDEAAQALSANSRAVVDTFQEKTAQMLDELTKQSNNIRTNYNRISDEATQALAANSQVVVNNFQRNTNEMAEMVDSLKLEIGQAAKSAVDAVTAVPNPYEDSALSAKMNGIEKDITGLKEAIGGLAQDDLREGLASILSRIEALSGRVEGLYAAKESPVTIEKVAESIADQASAAVEAVEPEDSEEPVEND